MKNKKANIFLFVLFCSCFTSIAQVAKENSIFWEVSGNELKDPSYLFGTFHLAGNEFADSLTLVMEKFRNAKTFAGEIILDSTMTERMMNASFMRDSTLEQVLGPGYKETSVWFQEVTQQDLTRFNQYQPITIELLLVSVLNKQLYPDQHGSIDVYFQELAKGNKKIAGLEQLEQQLDFLFKRHSYNHQGRQLLKLVSNKTSVKDSLIKINTLYRQQDLTALSKMMKEGDYYSGDDGMLLFDRNLSWLQTLLSLFREQSTFAAVGALHLTGEEGLVQLLRQHGYIVNPLPIR
jgi:uncharacterized protein